jgi:phosphopentomutase
MVESGCAKDSTAGHWELMGLPITRPFPTYPDGFPKALLEAVARATGYELIGNEVASGTEIVARLGEEAMRRKALIVYTSADSVFQIAAHEGVVGVDALYEACAVARGILAGEHAVARVIARPFVGSPGSFTRTVRRKDFSLPPTGRTVLDALTDADVRVLGCGKVAELFAQKGFSSAVHTATNAETMALVSEHMRTLESGLVFANLGDFDTLWGHRNDVEGFARGLEELDVGLGRLLDAGGADDVVMLTADHGCDPTTPSTDHSREAVPVLARVPGSPGLPLGARGTFADLGATVAALFGVPWDGPGTVMTPVAEAAEGGASG